MNPVTKLTISTVQLSTGLEFKLVHDLAETTWAALFNRWLRKAKQHTARSLIEFIKNRKPHCICVTKAQYDEITAGKSVAATKEEWEAENQNK